MATLLQKRIIGVARMLILARGSVAQNLPLPIFFFPHLDFSSLFLPQAIRAHQSRTIVLAKYTEKLVSGGMAAAAHDHRSFPYMFQQGRLFALDNNSWPATVSCPTTSFFLWTSFPIGRLSWPV